MSEIQLVSGAERYILSSTQQFQFLQQLRLPTNYNQGKNQLPVLAVICNIFSSAQVFQDSVYLDGSMHTRISPYNNERALHEKGSYITLTTRLQGTEVAQQFCDHVSHYQYSILQLIVFQLRQGKRLDQIRAIVDTRLGQLVEQVQTYIKNQPQTAKYVADGAQVHNWLPTRKPLDLRRPLEKRRMLENNKTHLFVNNHSRALHKPQAWKDKRVSQLDMPPDKHRVFEPLNIRLGGGQKCYLKGVCTRAISSYRYTMPQFFITEQGVISGKYVLREYTAEQAYQQLDTVFGLPLYNQLRQLDLCDTRIQIKIFGFPVVANILYQVLLQQQIFKRPFDYCDVVRSFQPKPKCELVSNEDCLDIMCLNSYETLKNRFIQQDSEDFRRVYKQFRRQVQGSTLTNKLMISQRCSSCAQISHKIDLINAHFQLINQDPGVYTMLDFLQARCQDLVIIDLFQSKVKSIKHVDDTYLQAQLASQLFLSDIKALRKFLREVKVAEYTVSDSQTAVGCDDRPLLQYLHGSLNKNG